MIYLATSNNKQFEYYYSNSKIIIFNMNSLITQMYFRCIPDVEIGVHHDGLFYRDNFPKERVFTEKGLDSEYVQELLFNISIDKLLL